MPDGLPNPGPCCGCGADLEHVHHDLATVRWRRGRRVPKNDSRVDYYRCPACRVAGQIVREIGTDSEIRRAGPAVDPRAARSLRDVLRRAVATGDPQSSLEERDRLLVGGTP